MQIESDHNRPSISYGEMKSFLRIGWGDLGARVAMAWRDYNKRYFANRLEPLPIIIVGTSPYGRWLGCTHCNKHKKRAHLIQLVMPRQSNSLVADNGVLLHEMLHQDLAERGESPKHEDEPWCTGIMRLHKAITGKRIWACPESIGKKLDQASGKRKSIRWQKPDPKTGKVSLARIEIATWPHSVKLDLGAL